MPKAKSSGVLRLSDARYRLWKSSPPKSFQWPAWNKKSSFQTSWQRAMMAFPLSRNCRCSDIRIILTKLMLSSSLNFYMEIDGNWLFFKFSLSSKIYIHIYTSYVYNCIYMFFGAVQNSLPKHTSRHSSLPRPFCSRRLEAGCFLLATRGREKPPDETGDERQPSG